MFLESLTVALALFNLFVMYSLKIASSLLKTGISNLISVSEFFLQLKYAVCLGFYNKETTYKYLFFIPFNFFW
jgi:hypothetical protein